MGLSIEEKHKLMLYPEVRITSKQKDKTVLGSGTIVYSKLIPNGDSDKGVEYETYVLTNEHVVDGLIEVKEKFSTLLKRNIKMDILGTPGVETFEYDFTSRVIGGTSYQAEIMCYDKDRDLALLRLKTRKEFPNVAKMYSYGKETELTCFMPVVNVGCGLGQKPVMTFGYLSGFGYEIDNEEFTLISAASIFGNSGGATFLEETGELLGVPSRISVIFSGWSSNPITHLGYSIPVWEVYRFLEDQVFNFIFDESVTSADCEEERERRRKAAELDMLRQDAQGIGKTKLHKGWKQY